MAAPASSPSSPRRRLSQLLSGLAKPVKAVRPRYLPLLTIYFAYGALGLIDVTRDMWIKERLTLSAAELAGLGVWLSLPWTMKMVVGALVDSTPFFGSVEASGNYEEITPQAEKKSTALPALSLDSFGYRIFRRRN